jgi:hypothetical protein
LLISRLVWDEPMSGIHEFGDRNSGDAGAGDRGLPLI